MKHDLIEKRSGLMGVLIALVVIALYLPLF